MNAPSGRVPFSFYRRVRSRAPSDYFFPVSLLEEASRRLGYISLTLGCLTLAGGVLQTLYSLTHQTLDLWIELPPDLLILFFSTFVFLVTRRQWLTPAQTLNLGRLYLVVICFVLAWCHWMPSQSVFEWTPNPVDMGGWRAAGPSWVAVAVLSFALVLPSRPWEALTTAVAATTTNVLALAIAYPLYLAPPPASELLIFFLLHYAVCLMVWAQSFIFVRFVSQVDAHSQIGAYRLVERLGQGGMGQVWRARHAMLARMAAVKLIRPEALSSAGLERDEAVARFTREAKITAALTSPHTVELYDYGQTEEGRLFSVMELLEGMDLAHMLECHGPLPVGRAVHLLRQMCLSLEEAHSVGLVHRDIKPGNVFVCRRGLQWDFVKILDFGLVFFKSPHEGALASLAGMSPGEKALELGVEATRGSVDYMAPEQIRGEDLDGRTDLYGLGCVAYYMLSGERVFEGHSIAVLAGHLSQDPDPVSDRATQAIPCELDDLILSCLLKEAGARPAGAREVRHQLEEIQKSYPWGEEDARLWWVDKPFGSGRSDVPSGSADSG